MVRTRNADKAAKDEAKEERIVEQPTETENTREPQVETPETNAEASTEEKKDDAAPKANDRIARFKALQARAVSTTSAG
jgi:pre-mRNA-splicing factor SYF2